MRTTRANMILAYTACFTLCLALVVALGGYFQSVERGGSLVGGEKRLLSQLKIFHERLKAAESPEEAKNALRVLDGVAALGHESEGSRELKKAYAPVLNIFANKPREAEAHFQLGKKRELMESLVNAYRKEIPHGDIRVRAAYLNILFDTQSSLLNETDEAEFVFLKRNRERFDGLKSVVAGAGDAALSARVAMLDGIFQAYERAFTAGSSWRAEKERALAAEDKALPLIAKSVSASEDSSVDETRRTFLYACFIALILAVTSFLTLYLGFKVMRFRAELKMDAFLDYLRAFGSERADKTALAKLRQDSEWATVVAEAERAEEAFLASCYHQLAVPRALHLGFFLMGKDKTVRYWNERGARLFGFKEGKEIGLADIVQPNCIRARDGETDALLELVKNAAAGTGEEQFELNVLQEGKAQPYALTICPVNSGPMAGGKIFFWREIQGEVERLDRAVAQHLERVRGLVNKLGKQEPVEFVVRENDVPAMRQMFADLETMKHRGEERELLWKTEAQALIDQVARQQEILHKLGDELALVRTGHAAALALVREVHGGEEHLHDEVCTMERDLERWVGNRRRLLTDLKTQAEVLDRAAKFEAQLRAATTAVQTELANFDGEIAKLRRFTEEARVHSVNLSLAEGGQGDYAARARAFAHDLDLFTATAAALGENVRQFLLAHPAGSLAAFLANAGVDEALVKTIEEEQERTSVALRRWKQSGETLISGGEKALALLEDAEKKAAGISQLGETSLLINQQARGNLERWN